MRNRYIDVLRAAAILRVVVYHLTGWPWLTILLPAMGVMFALAGSLMAGSLERRGAGAAVRSRIRRLLPPLWVLGAVAVPAMFAVGWTTEDGLRWHRLAYWVLPIGDPPGTEWGTDLWEPLWYLRAYLWFVLLSPVLFRAYRRAGWAAVVAPLGLLPLLHLTGLTLYGNGDAIAWDIAVYGACWMIGFAHHDGRLARLSPWALVPAVLALGAGAVWWLRGHSEGGLDLNEVPEAQALWSLAFVLMALWWRPTMAWLRRVRPLDEAVRVLNARAVTVYLWHNPAIALVFPLLTVLGLDDLGALDVAVALVAALVITVPLVAATGWAEDLAARRRPQLWPRPDGDRPDGDRPDGDRPRPDRRERISHWTHGPGASPDFHRRPPPTSAPAARTGPGRALDAPVERPDRAG